jgi:hypothetical protein
MNYWKKLFLNLVLIYSFQAIVIAEPLELEWIKDEMKSMNISDYNIAYDQSGNVYIAGYFHEKALLGGESLVSVGGYDIFLAKFDRRGRMKWLRQIGGSGIDVVKYINVDNQNNVYITGYITGDVFFDDAIFKNNTGYNVFNARYDEEGNLDWIKTRNKELRPAHKKSK